MIFLGNVGWKYFKLFALILPLFLAISWLLHYYNTHKIKIKYIPCTPLILFINRLWKIFDTMFPSAFLFMPTFCPPYTTVNWDLVLPQFPSYFSLNPALYQAVSKWLLEWKVDTSKSWMLLHNSFVLGIMLSSFDSYLLVSERDVLIVHKTKQHVGDPTGTWPFTGSAIE